MTVTVVLDGQGLHAWAMARPPRDLLAVMEVLRRHGSGRVIVPSVVTVEALTGSPRDHLVDQALRSIEVQTTLELAQTRRAAALREGLKVSAADAVVAEAALSAKADYVITADPEDLTVLLAAGEGPAPVVVTVPRSA